MKTTKLMTLKEEVAAIIRYKLVGCEKAKVKIHDQYVRLIMKQAHSFYKRTKKDSITLDDLIAEGTIGLMTAIEKHNVFRCDKMYPTAMLYIREAIQCYIMDNMSLTRNLSSNSNGRKVFHRFGKTCRDLGFQSPLTVDQVKTISEKLKVPERDITFMESISNKSEDSIDNSIIEWRSDHDQDSIDTDLDYSRVLNRIYNKYLQELSEREKEIAKRRILTDEPDSAKDMAVEFGVSTSSIYQSEKKIQSKLIKMAQDDLNIRAA